MSSEDRPDAEDPAGRAETEAKTGAGTARPVEPRSVRDLLATEPVTVLPLDGPPGADPPPRRAAPAVDPAAPLDPALRMSPDELAAQAAKPPPPPSRRLVLGTAGLVLLGAGAGVGWSFWRTRSPRRRSAPPELLAAARDEHALIAALDAQLSAHPERRALYLQVRSDHLAHAVTLEAAIREHTGRPAALGAAGTPVSTSVLRLEQQAAGVAARRAAALTGRDAALLASISACEAAHAVLLG